MARKKELRFRKCHNMGSKNMKWYVLVLTASAIVLGGCATCGFQKNIPPTGEAKAVARTVADAVLRDHVAPLPFGWGEGVLMAGMMRAHDMTGDERYLDFVCRWADHWVAHGIDDLLVERGYCGHWGPAFALLLLYEKVHDPRYLALAQTVLDFMDTKAERTHDGGLSHFFGKPQLWLDTLYMVCPVYSTASRVVERPMYQDEACRQLLLFAYYLGNRDKQLYYHMYDEETAQPTTEFWARGNGWLVMALTETLRNETKGSENWHRLVAVQAPLLDAIVRLQDPDTGLWHTVLDAPDLYVETSASAMFLFGLLQAREMGVPISVSDDVIERAWNGLVNHVDDRGHVTGVSSGTGPSSEYARVPTGTKPWGTGAFLMAAWALDRSTTGWRQGQAPSTGRPEKNAEKKALKQLRRDLDLARPGLETVQRSFASGNQLETGLALLDYFRTRPRAGFYFQPDEVPRIADAITLDMPEAAKQIITDANKILVKRFPSTCAPTFPNWVELPEDFSWTFAPDGDVDVTYVLQRQAFWELLGQAYAFTGDEKYAHCFSEQAGSWMANVPLPATDPANRATIWWNTLNAGLRCQSWVWAYHFMLNSEAMTPTLHFRLLAMLAEHARLLYANHAPLNMNWSTVEMQGLLTIALAFPEFVEATEWRDYALDNLARCLDMQVRPDGVQLEQSPSYHVLCQGVFAETQRLAAINDHQLYADRSNLLEKMADFTRWAQDPSGRLVAVSDTDRDSSGQVALMSAALQHDPDNGAAYGHVIPRHYWLFGPDRVRSARKSPAMNPAETLRVFPDGGYVFARSDWSTDARYFVLDCGPHGGAHGHWDLLSVELHGYGTPLVVDPGRYGYFNQAGGRCEVQPSVHNTITLDGLAYQAFENPDRGGIRLLAAEKRDGWIYIHAQHRAYVNLSGPPLLDRRVWFNGDDLWVVSDTVSAPRAHDVRVNWQFPGTGASRLPDGSVVSAPRGQARIHLTVGGIPRPAISLEERRVHPAYRFSNPADRAVLHSTGLNTCTISILKALRPDETTAETTVTVTQETGLRPGMARVTRQGESYLFDLTEDG